MIKPVPAFLSCPFCGSPEVGAMKGPGILGRLYCAACKAEGPLGLTHDGFVRLWNTRVPLPRQEQRLVLGEEEK